VNDKSKKKKLKSEIKECEFEAHFVSKNCFEIESKNRKFFIE
jgi:hypothetical protein